MLSCSHWTILILFLNKYKHFLAYMGSSPLPPNPNYAEICTCLWVVLVHCLSDRHRQRATKFAKQALRLKVAQESFLPLTNPCQGGGEA